MRVLERYVMALRTVVEGKVTWFIAPQILGQFETVASGFGSTF